MMYLLQRMKEAAYLFALNTPESSDEEELMQLA